ncbi:YpsA SLOG family protein [Verrucomicrobium spinosum]|uniref:YpsA SLOG family protein n=1 Tax=Verrucomicrobium spinosum TaxID=2736 RepID=UPI0001746389|nr:putative molybdenum carrier protein [Verrucomicrobium spinosum]
MDLRSLKASGGSAKTLAVARKTRKPHLHLHAGLVDAVGQLRVFIEAHHVAKLNVAGSRESKEPGLYAWTTEVLTAALK